MELIGQQNTRVHDLVRFVAAAYEAQLPPWVTGDPPSRWGVVRRQRAKAHGTTALGLRGPARSERLPLDVHDHDILEVVAPEDLHGRVLSTAVNPGLSSALSVLSTAGNDELGGLAWGPTGSAGFELATGLPAVRATSDLDMILRADEPLAGDDARGILRFLLTLPCRVDCLLETGLGAVALGEWASATGAPVLLRTPGGPVVTDDPWQDDGR